MVTGTSAIYIWVVYFRKGHWELFKCFERARMYTLDVVDQDRIAARVVYDCSVLEKKL